MLLVAVWVSEILVAKFVVLTSSLCYTCLKIVQVIVFLLLLASGVSGWRNGG